MSRKVPAARAWLAAALLAAALPASATQTRTLLSSSQDLWQGFPDGTQVTEEGAVLPGTGYRKACDLPGVPLCALRVGPVLYVGTAPGGDLLRVEGEKVSVLHHFEEPLVTALALSKDGNLLVGTGTPGKVYRVACSDGAAKELASAGADYVWVLLERPDGILAATGSPGKVLRLDGAGKSETLVDASSGHVRALLESKGALWIGTASPAQILRFENGKSFLAATLKQEEVAGLAEVGGSLWIACNDKASAPQGSSAKGSSGGGSCRLWILDPSGALSERRSFDAAATFLAAEGSGALLGLSDGRLVRCSPGGLALAAHWDGPSPAAAAAGPGGAWVVTAGPGELFAPDPSAVHAYLAPVADCGAPAKLGRCAVSGARASLFVRAGNAARPDGRWTPWTDAASSAALPASQFFQWKAVLEEGGEARLESVAYRAVNRPPDFASARVHPPGEVFVRNPAQLGEHLVREVDQKQSAFPGLAKAPSSDSPPQTYYLQGFRMVTWKAEDPDGDDLEVRIDFRPAHTEAWFTLARRVKDPFYVFDARGLPDGEYDLRLTVSDADSNEEGDARTAELVLPPFVVDNTPPTLSLAPSRPGHLSVTAQDNTGVQSVRASVDGEPWVTLAPEGPPGGRTWKSDAAVPDSGRHWIVVQAADANSNQAVASFFTR